MPPFSFPCPKGTGKSLVCFSMICLLLFASDPDLLEQDPAHDEDQRDHGPGSDRLFQEQGRQEQRQERRQVGQIGDGRDILDAPQGQRPEKIGDGVRHNAQPADAQPLHAPGHDPGLCQQSEDPGADSHDQPDHRHGQVLIHIGFFVQHGVQSVTGCRKDAAQHARQSAAAACRQVFRRQDDDADKGADDGNAFFRCQLFFQKDTGENDQHDRPQIVEDAGLLRTQCGQAVIIQRRVKEHSEKPQTAHGADLPERILSDLCRFSLFKVQQKQKCKCKEAADAQCFHVWNVCQDCFRKRSHGRPDQNGGQGKEIVFLQTGVPSFCRVCAYHIRTYSRNQAVAPNRKSAAKQAKQKTNRLWIFPKAVIY